MTLENNELFERNSISSSDSKIKTAADLVPIEEMAAYHSTHLKKYAPGLPASGFLDIPPIKVAQSIDPAGSESERTWRGTYGSYAPSLPYRQNYDHSAFDQYERRSRQFQRNYLQGYYSGGGPRDRETELSEVRIAKGAFTTGGGF